MQERKRMWQQGHLCSQRWLKSESWDAETWLSCGLERCDELWILVIMRFPSLPRGDGQECGEDHADEARWLPCSP